MVTFVHTGLPKTLTSALQRSFFAAHPEIYYLGIGVGGPIDFIDDAINLIFDDLLVYAKGGYYDYRKAEAIAAISLHRNRAEAARMKAFGISSEWLSFTLSADMIDNAEKPRRIAELLGDNARVLLILRNQGSLLRSLYGQYVREGLALTYAAFLEYLHDFQDRNFFFDLHYHLQWKNLAKNFGNENVHLLPLEHFRTPAGVMTNSNGKINLLERVCEILEIRYPEGFELPTVNPSLTAGELYHKRILNRKNRHDFGNLMFDHANRHRSRKFFEKENAYGVTDFFTDIRTKNRSLQIARSSALTDPRDCDYSANPELTRKLKATFETANRELVSLTGLSLPETYFDIKL